MSATHMPCGCPKNQAGTCWCEPTPAEHAPAAPLDDIDEWQRLWDDGDARHFNDVLQYCRDLRRQLAERDADAAKARQTWSDAHQEALADARAAREEAAALRTKHRQAMTDQHNADMVVAEMWRERAEASDALNRELKAKLAATEAERDAARKVCWRCMG